MNHDDRVPRSSHPHEEADFPRKMWGLDAERVWAHVDRLTNQLHIADRELEVIRTENDRLRIEYKNVQHELQTARVEFQAMQAELQRVRGELKRAHAELEDAQEQLDEYEHSGDKVNDQIIEMFSQAQLIAEEMVADVSRDARERIEQAREHERQIVEQAVNSAGSHVHEYALTAQAQMQSIMESFAQQVDQLGVAAAAEQAAAAAAAVAGDLPGFGAAGPGAAGAAGAAGSGPTAVKPHQNGAEHHSREG